MRTRRAGLELHAQVAARHPGGPWLVSVHGFMGSGDRMRPALRLLQRTMNVLAVDLPGHGRSQGSEDPERFAADELVDDVMCWIRRLRLPRCVLHGYSMGGRVGWRWLDRLAQGHAEEGAEICGVILESAHPGLADPAERQIRRRLDTERARSLKDDPAGFMREWETMPLLAGGRSRGEKGREGAPHETQALHENQAHPAQDRAAHDGHAAAPHSPDSEALAERAAGFAACLLGFGPGRAPAADLGAVSRLDLPLLLLAGALDTPYAALLERASTALPRAKHLAIPGAAHRVWMDRPEAWARAVSDFASTC